MTLIGQSIAMFVFVWFCMKFIWPPIMSAIEERQTQIADGLAAAERGQENLDKARVDAARIIEEARNQLGPGFIRILGYFREDGQVSLDKIEAAMNARDTG